jgi:hypothetical protein
MKKTVLLEVFRNGKRLCIAGRVGDGMLSAMLVAVANDESSKSRISFDLQSHNYVTDESSDWLGTKSIRVGDEILIKVISGQPSDAPKTTKRFDRKRSIEKTIEFHKGEYERLSAQIAEQPKPLAPGLQSTSKKPKNTSKHLRKKPASR